MHMTEPLRAVAARVRLRIDLRMDRCTASGRHAVMIVVDGFPAGAPMTHVVAAILASLKQALAAEAVETTLTYVH